MRLRPTARLAGLLVIAGCVYLAAFNTDSIWLYTADALLLGLVPVGVIGPLLAARGGGVEVVAVEHRGGRGADLRHEHQGVLTGERVVLRLGRHPDLDVCDLGPALTSTGARWPCGVELEPDGPRLVGQPERLRGQRRIVAVVVTSSWPLGLAQASRTVAMHASILVQPRYAAAGDVPGYDAIGGMEPLRRGQTDDFVGLREYQPGDARRHIHWRATARRGQLTVIQRAAPADRAVTVGFRVEAGVSPEQATLAAEVVASLLAECTRRGRPFRLSVGDGEPQARLLREALSRLALSPGAATAATPACLVEARHDGLHLRSDGADTVAAWDGQSLEDALMALNLSA